VATIRPVLGQPWQEVATTVIREAGTRWKDGTFRLTLPDKRERACDWVARARLLIIDVR
jgi:hypothetical protein